MEELVKELRDEAKDPWKGVVLALVADGLEKFGPLGVEKASEAIRSLLNGETVVMDWMDLTVASDLLAQMQNAEADRKEATDAFLEKVGMVLGKMAGGFLRGLL